MTINHITTNWKTTLLGIFYAIVNVVIPLIQNDTINKKTIVSSVAVAALGVLAKDGNVTGGDVNNL